MNLLDAIRGAGVSLWVDDTDHLHVWPVANLTNDQLARLKADKEQVIAILRQHTADLLPDEATISKWQKQANQPAPMSTTTNQRKAVQ